MDPVAESRQQGERSSNHQGQELSNDDWKVLENYQAFGAELSRIAFIEIGGILWALFSKDGDGIRQWLQPHTPWQLPASLAILSSAALASLLHRYLSGDSMAEIVFVRRRQAAGREASMNLMRAKLKLSGYLLLLASILLIAGTALTGWIIVTFVRNLPANPSLHPTAAVFWALDGRG